jgi:exonuclease III
MLQSAMAHVDLVMLGLCSLYFLWLLMHTKYFRKWKVLYWNFRGLNLEERQREVRSKIEESQCAVVCLQETKCDYFDHKFIRKFCPKRLDNFVYSPSVGSSGGIIILWNSAIFTGVVQEIKRFGISLTMSSVHNGESWTLVSVYGPCQGIQRDNLTHWLYNLHILATSNWLLIGDFNFIRSNENRINLEVM